jgi:hypothetical protein
VGGGRGKGVVGSVATIIVALGSWKEVCSGEETLLKNKRLQCILECKRGKKKNFNATLKYKAKKEINWGMSEEHWMRKSFVSVIMITPNWFSAQQNTCSMAC